MIYVGHAVQWIVVVVESFLLLFTLSPLLLSSLILLFLFSVIRSNNSSVERRSITLRNGCTASRWWSKIQHHFRFAKASTKYAPLPPLLKFVIYRTAFTSNGTTVPPLVINATPGHYGQCNGSSCTKCCTFVTWRSSYDRTCYVRFCSINSLQTFYILVIRRV